LVTDSAPQIIALRVQGGKCGGSSRQVEGGVVVEEADRSQGEPQRATGITGQSSGRGKWVIPKVCQSTMSWPSMSRSAAT
jgi:hypothetical protein